MDKKVGCLYAGFFIFCLVLIGIEISVSYDNPHTEQIVIKDKGISSSQKNSYLVFTESEVYEIQDLWLIGFFTSSDLYNRINVGDTIQAKVYGRREPILSSYKNIVSITQKQ